MGWLVKRRQRELELERELQKIWQTLDLRANFLAWARHINDVQKYSGLFVEIVVSEERDGRRNTDGGDS